MHPRITPQGQHLGQLSATLEQQGAQIMQSQGLHDLKLPRIRETMCKSCACIPGTVPNGCFQTQMDLLKAAHEGKPFFCHAPKNGQLCRGWTHARAAFVAQPPDAELGRILDAWEYSPPDAAETP